MYSIGEFSKITNISNYTLRYYEKEKLIIPSREKNGRRSYSENDITWIEFIKKLKDTKMPIKEIKKYAEFRNQGNPTMKMRMDMLTEHRIKLKEEISKLNKHLLNLDDKIEFYRTSIEQLKDSE